MVQVSHTTYAELSRTVEPLGPFNLAEQNLAGDFHAGGIVFSAVGRRPEGRTRALGR